MIKKILHPKEIEHATGIIDANGKWGTTFLVASDESSLCITTSHNISGASSIDITFRKEGKTYKRTAEIVDQSAENDVALLKLNEPISEIAGLPIAVYDVAYDENWDSFGYPTNKGMNGGRINGKIARINEGEDWDIDLECTQFTSIQDFAGFSGSALVINGLVVGVINLELAGSLAATSLKLFKESLIKHNIPFQFFDHTDNIPNSIKGQADEAPPNQFVLDAIDKMLSENKTSDYFLMKGSPGSGKTTLAAQYRPSELIVADRYFVKVPNDEKVPTEIRATKENFWEWLESVFYKVLFNAPSPKSSQSVNDRLKDIIIGLSNMAAYYTEAGKVGLIIVDGLDDVKEGEIDGFLAAFSGKLPDGLRILFSCTSENILPSRIRSEFNSNNTVVVIPLSLTQAEQYLNEQIKHKNISSSQISLIAQKSEGHPLYLQYLLNYINELENVNELGDWITNIPKIGGEIEKYYKIIWDKISKNTDEIWTAATLSRLRQVVTSDTLIRLLPSQGQYAFPTAFSKIKHLLKDGEDISVYHTSFSDFINNETTTINNRVHENIASYCLKHKDSAFSVANRVYHLLSSDQHTKTEGIKECNQIWVDQAFLQSVNPDIILSDIRKAKSVAASLGLSDELIRVLLLAERVNFRYNNLFSHSDSGFYLITALLSLNKYDEALKYIIRNGVLTVKDDEAIYFLQKFNDYQADEQAEKILDAIRQRCNNLIEKGFDEDTFKRFINLRFKSITLSASSGREHSYREFNHTLKVVKKILKYHGNPDSAFDMIRDDVSAYNIGYYIWAFGIPPNLKDMVEKGIVVPDKKLTTYLSRVIISVSHFAEHKNIFDADDVIYGWVGDLEYAIENYGIRHEDSHIAASALLETSKRSHIVEKLINKDELDGATLEIRQKNRVDVDYSGIGDYTKKMAYRGYVDTENKYPHIKSDYWYGNNWENYLKSLIESISFILGKAHRLKADGKLSQISTVIVEYEKLLSKIDFTLGQRIYWDSAYSIPESVMPIIYTKVINFLVEYHPAGIAVLIKSLENDSRYQLGLYSEGYIESIFFIATTLSKYTSQTVNAHKAASVLENFILSTCQNRWERTEYLLRLIEIFATIENGDKANELFKEVMNSSMGPSWYKEAQLGLINTVTTAIRLTDTRHLQKLAAHLDFASGEMTFQRYVRQQQEDYVENLADIGQVKLAIDYFKYLVFPNYGTILENAESGLSDMPSLGNGYVLGARAIEEQAGILSLLTPLVGNNKSHPYILWSLAELFIPGDDRYLRGFGKVQANILNACTNQKDIFSTLIERLVKFTIEEVSPDSAFEYLSELAQNLAAPIYQEVKTQLKNKQITLPKVEQEDEVKSNGRDILDELDEYIKEAKQLIEVKNRTAARKKIVDGLTYVQSNNYSVWFHNISSKINSLVDLLGEAYENSSDLIESIEPLITNEPYQEDWHTADRLIGILSREKEINRKEAIVAAVEDHVKVMVRTSESCINKYSFLSTTSDEKYLEEPLLIELLFWLLNHPRLIMKNRTFNSLIWLGSQIPSKVIPIALKDIKDDSSFAISRELSAAILHGIARQSPDTFWPEFKNHFSVIEEWLFNTDHFMIKNTFIELLQSVNENIWVDANDHRAKLLTSLPLSTNDGHEIQEDEIFKPIQEYLDELNELNIVGPNFVDELKHKVDSMLPLEIDEFMRADRYVDRSFNNFNEVSIISEYENLLRCALNRVATKYATQELRVPLASILRFYQPTFPLDRLRAELKQPHIDFLESVKKLFSGELTSFDEIRQINDAEVYIHFYSEMRSNEDRRLDTIEILAELVPSNYTGNVYDTHAEYRYYKMNDYLYNSTSKDIPMSPATPLVVQSKYKQSIGEALLPSYLIDNINTFFPSLKTDAVHFDYWRNGRIWAQQKHGSPIHSGYSYSAPLEMLKDIDGKYKIIWKLNYNYRTIIVDFIARKIFKPRY